MQPGSLATISATPFPVQTPLGEVVAHSGWQQARHALLTVVEAGGAAALVGPPGTGKSLLLQDVAHALRQAGLDVQVLGAGDALAPAAYTDAVLVDDAASYPAAALAALLRLRKPLVLAGPESLLERPEVAARLAARRQRRMQLVPLRPLPLNDIARFVAGRLAAADRPRTLLLPDAILALSERSGGLPRCINMLAGTSVFMAELEEASHVDRHHVERAAAMCGGDGNAADDGEEVSAAEQTVEPDETGELDRVIVGLALPHSTLPRIPSVAPQPRRRALLVATGATTAVITLGFLMASHRSAPPVSEPPRTMRDTFAMHDAPAVPDRPDLAGSAPSTATTPPALLSPPQVPAAKSAPLAALRRFQGTIYNQTMQQGGQLVLVIRPQSNAPAASSAVIAHFHASDRLLGTGELTGTLFSDGRLQLSGALSMGRNTFDCQLSARVSAEALTGVATFVRSGHDYAAHSSFSLRPSG